MKKEFSRPETIYTVATLSIFYFVFLGAEYLFDNMMAYVTDAKGVVLAQNYILGISVVGFVLFSMLDRLLKNFNQYIVMFVTALPAIICIFVIQQHMSYPSIMAAGLILFLNLGILGSAVHYAAAKLHTGSVYLGRISGISYALGLLLQFVNNNAVNQEIVEAVILSLFLSVMAVMFVKNNAFSGKMSCDMEECKENSPENPLAAGVLFLVIVALMSCVFVTLDSAVTLVHARGEVDIGQWPRLFLALSGLAAGVVFDIRKRKYMSIVMYCIMLLSVICVVVIEYGGPFLVGLIVFYLSAGFFAVYFATGFMELSAYMRVPQLWAGLGRAVNNGCAIVISPVSVALLTTGNVFVISIVSLVIFAAISVLIHIYGNEFHYREWEEKQERSGVIPDRSELLEHFAGEYSLTEREKEVLKILLDSDENVQEIAHELNLSRAALYRHIGNINEKTNTTSRIGILQFYYAWEKEKILNLEGV